MHACEQVLDIGQYVPAGVEWVVHEVEQPGSWHTTVGEKETSRPFHRILVLTR